MLGIRLRWYENAYDTQGPQRDASAAGEVLSVEAEAVRRAISVRDYPASVYSYPVCDASREQEELRRILPIR